MSCGAIPVVYSDGWVLPFERLLDPSEYAVVIPQADVNRTQQILESIPKDKICDMRKKGMTFYEEYIATPEGTIKGIIDTLELPFEQATKAVPTKGNAKATG